MFRVPAVLAEDFFLEISELFSFLGKQVFYVTFETIVDLHDTNDMLGFNAQQIVDVDVEVL